MNTNIESLYDYVLQQMAAESYFEGVSPSNLAIVKERLLVGANRDGAGDDSHLIGRKNPELRLVRTPVNDRAGDMPNRGVA